MWLAGFGVESLSYDAAVTDDDAAHHRVRAGVASRRARQLDAPPHVVAVQVPRRLRLAPHAGRDPAPAKAPGRDAGPRRGGQGGGGDGSRGEVCRGGHGRRAEAREPNPWGSRVSVRGGREGLVGGLGRLVAEGEHLSIRSEPPVRPAPNSNPPRRRAPRAPVPPLRPRRRLQCCAALVAISLSSAAAPHLPPQRQGPNRGAAVMTSLAAL